MPAWSCLAKQVLVFLGIKVANFGQEVLKSSRFVYNVFFYLKFSSFYIHYSPPLWWTTVQYLSNISKQLLDTFWIKIRYTLTDNSHEKMNNLKTDTMCSYQRVRRVLHLRESQKRMTQKRQRETLAGLAGSLNFIRLPRVVITPSVVERRKRLEAIGWNSGKPSWPLHWKKLTKKVDLFSLQIVRHDISNGVSHLFPQDKPEESIEKPKRKLRAVLQLQTIK